MKKKNLIVCISAGICILLVIVFIILKITFFDNKSNSANNSNASTCELLNKNIEEGNQVVMFYNYDDSNEEVISGFIKNLQSDYNLKNIFKVSYNSSNDCKKYITNNEDLAFISSNDSFVGLFNNKSFVGYISTVTDYASIVDYLSKNDFITKNVVTDEVSLDTVKKKIKNDKYIVFVVNDKNNKNDAVSIMNDYKNYDYDIISLDNLVGEDIYIYLKDKYKISSEIPQFIYFNNGKVKGNAILESDTFKSVVK